MKLLLLGITVFASLGLAQDFPAGPGRDVIQRVCTACHTLDVITPLHYSRAEWQDVVSSMADKGADASPDELDVVVAYLAKNFGKAAPKVNLNKAAASDLVSGLQLSQKDADALVAYRQAHGNFKNADDVAKVDGFDSKKVDGIKDRIEF